MKYELNSSNILKEALKTNFDNITIISDQKKGTLDQTFPHTEHRV